MGVTIYGTVPSVVLLGLVSVWLIVAPLEALAPVMPPVIAPNVQAKLLGALAANVMAVLVAVHIVFVAALVTAGFG